jgi:GNAT superfamily N-acetyltransferase
MKISIDHTIAPDAVADFYAVYVAAFDPLRTRAAARHMLTAEEFRAEMTDERIDKYVVRDEAGAIIALGTLATDLAAIPWISPEYFAAHYPEQLARGAVYYLGYTLVKPEHARTGAYRLIMDHLERRCSEDRAVCGYDVCAYNDARTIGRRSASLAESWGARVDQLDVQTYYAASFS